MMDVVPDFEGLKQFYSQAANAGRGMGATYDLKSSAMSFRIGSKVHSQCSFLVRLWKGR